MHINHSGESFSPCSGLGMHDLHPRVAGVERRQCHKAGGDVVRAVESSVVLRCEVRRRPMSRWRGWYLQQQVGQCGRDKRAAAILKCYRHRCPRGGRACRAASQYGGGLG
eukprot:4499368-Prymnesium_polylepis.4